MDPEYSQSSIHVKKEALDQGTREKTKNGKKPLRREAVKPKVAVASVIKKNPKKRGPPRPHKKLEQDILEARIVKLQRRIDRASGQLTDAQRHIDGYSRELGFRQAENVIIIP